MTTDVRPGGEPKQERSQATRRRLLEAAVDCLIEDGYTGLTTAKVSERAEVSRGAQQHHFPHKAALVSEAVGQLAERHAEIIREGARAQGGDVEKVLDLLWESYSGRLFAAWTELSLAARHDPELGEMLGPFQRSMDRGVVETCRETFGPEVAGREGFEHRLELVLATIRGLAMLRLFGHPTVPVERQWGRARGGLAALLEQKQSAWIGSDSVHGRPR